MFSNIPTLFLNLNFKTCFSIKGHRRFLISAFLFVIFPFTDTFGAHGLLHERDFRPIPTLRSSRTTTNDTCCFSIEKNTATLTSFPRTSPSGILQILDTYKGYPVTSIKTRSLSQFAELTTIVIPSSVTNIAPKVFELCNNLTNIAVATNNPNYSSVDGVLFDKTASVLLECPRGKSGTCNIPCSVTNIAPKVFELCNNLTNIAVATNNPNYSSVDGVLFDKTASVLLECPRGKSGTCNIPCSVTNIAPKVFELCNNLTNIAVATNNPIYSSFDGVLFDKQKSTLLKCPNGRVGAYTMPNSVRNISPKAFLGYSALTSLTISANVTTISAYTFDRCSNLIDVTLPANLTNIGEAAFADCSGLTQVIIPSSVTNVDRSAFACCTSLTNIVVSENNPKYTTIDGVLFDKDKTNIVIFPEGKSGHYTLPESVVCIPYSAFTICTNLTSVNIPDGVLTIGEDAFRDCENLTNINIPSTITNIGPSAFCDCSKLRQLVLPQGISRIEGATFADCSSLTNIIIPKSVNYIGPGAFSGCSSLVDITVPAGVTIIEAGTFSGCSSLTNITMPTSVSSIGKGAFSGCSLLSVISIPDSVTKIGAKAFNGCSSLSSITIPKHVVQIGSGSSHVSTNSTQDKFRQSMLNSLESTFSGCISLTKIYFTGDAPKISADFNTGVTTHIYYLPSTKGWGTVFGGCPTKVWEK